jgi:hypothetical protein
MNIDLINAWFWIFVRKKYTKYAVNNNIVQIIFLFIKAYLIISVFKEGATNTSTSRKPMSRKIDAVINPNIIASILAIIKRNKEISLTLALL